MAEPFGDKQQGAGGAGKRPAQTIDGTATEVSVEQAPDPEARVESGPEPDAGEPPHLTGGAAEAAEAEPASPPANPPELKSFVTHLAAGVLGGLIGVVALAFAWGGLDLGKQSGPSPDLARLEERVGKLESAPPPAADAEALSQLESRIAALEVNTRQTPAELVELEGRVAQLESSLKALAETASEGGSVAAAAAIGQQIAEAEQRLDARIAAALAEREAANTSTLQEVQGELAQLKAKLGALADAELGTGEGADLGPELNQLSDRIAKLEATLPDLVGAIGKEAQGAKSAAVAIAFANLRAAVSDGRPYAAELDTLGALAPALGDLGILPAYAEKGIPTLPELARSFDISRNNALAATAPVADGSFLDNLWASAQSLVTIRRIDEAPAGEGPDPTLARARVALDKGDLEGAVKEVETLDGPARNAFSLWLGQALARLGADAILTRLEGVLLVSMGGEAPQQP
jgi:hypothetical protein